MLPQVLDTEKDGKHVVPNVARLVDPFAVHTDGHATATPQDLAAITSSTTEFVPRPFWVSPF
ncbi:hypothetical protein V7799_02050 [Rhizobium laguerreae]